MLALGPLPAAAGPQSILIGIATVIVLGVLAQWVAWRFRLPSILLLLLLGFMAGPVTGFLDPQALQGNWVFAFVSLSIGIILFEAGLSLRLDELREVGKPVRNLITVGVLTTWVLAALAAFYIAAFSLPMAVLVGAILTVTGPTVVVPLLRHVRPTGRVGVVAKWEGITIDPIGAILSVLVLEAIVILNQPEAAGSGIGGAIGHVAEDLLLTVIVSVGISILGAAFLILLLHRRLVPDYLQSAVALMVVIGTFAFANVLQEEAGLLEATLLGIIMANQPYVPVRRIAEFKENLQVLLLAGLFILLSARLELSVLQTIDTRALMFLAVLILVVRPAAVALSSLGTQLNWKEQAFLAWMAPRGIVAAAVASLFAFRLDALFPAEAERLVPIVFLVIVGTVAIYGLTISPLARSLGLAQPNPQGLLFVGAHSWARSIASTLDQLGFTVLLVDSNPNMTQRARQEGLLAERANALSERLIDELDLSGIGRLVALTPNDEVNALAALHFSEVFETATIYQIATRPNAERSDVGDLPRHLRGHLLFGEGVTFDMLADRFAAGDEVRPIELTETRTYEALRAHYEEDLLPLFLVRGTQLHVFTEDVELKPQPGDTLLALVSPSGQEERWQPETAEATPEKKKDQDRFGELIARAEVVDLQEAISYEEVVREASARLAERLPEVTAEALVDRYLAEAWQEHMMISRGVALPHLRLPDVEQPELVVARCRSGLGLGAAEAKGNGAADGSVYALFFLVSPEAYPSRHLRILAQLASRIDDPAFLAQWRAADDHAEVRAMLQQQA